VKHLIHKALMRVIPWKAWGWKATHRLMRVNYWANKEQFDRLAMHGSDHLTTHQLGRLKGI